MVLLIGSFAIYLTNWRTLGAGDTEPASLLPISILTRRTVDLSEFAPIYKASSENPTFLVRTEHGYFSTYPLAPGILAVPIYALPVFWIQAAHHPTAEEWYIFGVIVMDKIAGAIFTALSVYAFYFVCLALGARGGTALILSLAYAFGSEAWTTSSQALWMHGPGILFMLLSILLALKQAENPDWKKALLLGICCGMCVTIRINNILFVAPLLGWVFLTERRSFFVLLVPVVLLIGLLFAYNHALFGRITGMYAMAFNEPVLDGIAGLLFSPGRGMAIYFPIGLFAGPGLWLAFREANPHRSLYLAFLIFLLTNLVLVAKWDAWYGGWSYGPRLLAETQPILLLMAIPTCEVVFYNVGTMFWKVIFFLLLTWSVGVHGLGAYRQSEWNATPQDVNSARWRLWDWVDNPISRALKAPMLQGGWPPFSVAWFLPVTELARVSGPNIPDWKGEKVFVEFGSGWYPIESIQEGLKIQTWRWSSADAEIIVQNPQIAPVKGHLHLKIGTYAPRHLTLTLNGALLWQGEIQPKGVDIDSVEVALSSGSNKFVLQSNEPGIRPSGGNDRLLVFYLEKFEISLQNTEVR